MSLKERIEQKKRTDARLLELRRDTPVWIKRMQQKGLPDVDHTADLKVAA